MIWVNQFQEVTRTILINFNITACSFYIACGVSWRILLINSYQRFQLNTLYVFNTSVVHGSYRIPLNILYHRFQLNMFRLFQQIYIHKINKHLQQFVRDLSCCRISSQKHNQALKFHFWKSICTIKLTNNVLTKPIDNSQSPLCWIMWTVNLPKSHKFIYLLAKQLVSRKSHSGTIILIPLPEVLTVLNCSVRRLNINQYVEKSSQNQRAVHVRSVSRPASEVKIQESGLKFWKLCLFFSTIPSPHARNQLKVLVLWFFARN